MLLPLLCLTLLKLLDDVSEVFVREFVFILDVVWRVLDLNMNVFLNAFLASLNCALYPRL
jgi:hypothetical protein